MRVVPAFVIAGLLIAPVTAATAQQNNNGLGHVVTQPLRDTRIKDEKIPAVLQRAASAPYSAVGTQNCAAITAQIRDLNGALGADVDTPAKQKGEGSAIAAAGARAVVGTLIPGLGLVRVITGADKAQRRAEAAVYAGAVRRGYLKGLGLAKRCRVPAAPTAASLAAKPELLAADQ
ncbi:hypothetical protein PX554_17355 [Sphingomonas sp. H39-1-10]|uniref:hypothetical protein n=1 Tax=Sphingomonas pollutisoli TaxID=3030829 RepID=UPI0023B8BC36|nr:hypothetical protein [Sphingomonas pollutisoli]MDF0489905.1 hypothetical protein [Sphingomonas pollutisoli]